MLNRGTYLMLSSIICICDRCLALSLGLPPSCTSSCVNIQCGFIYNFELRATINSEDSVDNRYGCEILLEMYYRFLAPASSSYLQLALKGHNTQHSGHMGQNFSI